MTPEAVAYLKRKGYERAAYQAGQWLLYHRSGVVVLLTRVLRGAA